jgi:hypothetical protein
MVVKNLFELQDALFVPKELLLQHFGTTFDCAVKSRGSGARPSSSNPAGPAVARQRAANLVQAKKSTLVVH